MYSYSSQRGLVTIYILYLKPSQSKCIWLIFQYYETVIYEKVVEIAESAEPAVLHECTKCNDGKIRKRI